MAASLEPVLSLGRTHKDVSCEQSSIYSTGRSLEKQAQCFDRLPWFQSRACVWNLESPDVHCREEGGFLN